MRTSELRQREDFGAVLRATLEVHWSLLHGRAFRVATGPIPGAQVWRLQPLLSAVFTGKPCTPALRFLAEGFRYTPVIWRTLPQWLLGAGLATNAGMRLTSTNVYWVEPDVPNASGVLVVPGNRRIRIFDFLQGTCRVCMKAGYPTTANAVETGIRCGGGDGPYPGVLARDEGGRWFEEPIVRGVALARCPPWQGRRSHEITALASLAAWIEANGRVRKETGAVASLVERVAEGGRRLAGTPRGSGGERFGSVARALGELAGDAGYSTAVGHGDFQPGNVIVERTTGRVLIIDWEHSARRWRDYDFYVWGLGSRYRSGLQRRMQAYLDAGFLGAAGRHVEPGGTSAQRMRNLSVFLLEDLAWHIDDNSGGPRQALAPLASEALACAERFVKSRAGRHRGRAEL